jgi:CelD/BcsL family acetyltransferase involved in cellulose biosynthesis
VPRQTLTISGGFDCIPARDSGKNRHAIAATTIGQLMSYSQPVLADRSADGDVADTPAATPRAVAQVPSIELSVVSDIALVESEWRAFERKADCTVFQTFAWQSAWLKNVGPHKPVTPAIVIGRTAERELLFLIPLALERRGTIRRLTWLASDLCDYNAPLLARDFAARVGSHGFPPLWRQILDRLGADPRFRPDVVILEKMPETVGAQPNPFMALDCSPNPSSAYLAHLSGSWDEFYTARRSSATRRRDRTKLKRLADFGDVRFVTPDTRAAIEDTLSALFSQKSKSFARMGIPDIFARPGWSGFFRQMAADPLSRQLVHVSRIEVGDMLAATNFGLVFGGCYYHILAGYDDGDVAKYGPGAAHLRDLMRYAIEHGCDAFDFTIGDEAYKQEWSDTLISLRDLRSALTWRGTGVVLVSTALSQAKRTIKNTPALWRLATRLRAALGRRGDTAPAAKADDAD